MHLIIYICNLMFMNLKNALNMARTQRVRSSINASKLTYLLPTPLTSPAVRQQPQLGGWKQEL